jgi:NADPH:quinone reductase-like Zn-dependent oxidoreductase
VQSSNAPSPELTVLPVAAEGGTMRAIVQERYGRPEVLELREVAIPVLEDDRVLVRVHASSVNPAEWYQVTGPLFARSPKSPFRPTRREVGADVAGTIEAAGKDVTEFRPGDEVYGITLGAWAEYALARERNLVPKPAGVSFDDAGAMPIAGLTALQGLRDHGRVQPGQKVLINGASGGVGTYAVQLAKVLGADVTAVCSTRNVKQARALGADRVVDYRREDFTRLPERHDLVLDISGSRSFLEVRRVMKPDATFILVGGRMTYRGLGPLPHLAGTFLKSRGRSQKLKFFISKSNKEDLAFLVGLLEAGTMKSVIDRRYDLSQAAEALAYLGEGHARGKVVITV